MAWVRIDDVEQACQLRDAGLLWRYIPEWDVQYHHLIGAWSAHSIRKGWVDANRARAGFYILTEE